MTRKVLVTGAAGFVGRQLVPMLAAEGHAVRASVRSPQVAWPQADEGVLPVDLHLGSLPNPELVEKLCAGIDVVIHAAGLAHVNADPAAMRAANLDATLELAQAAKIQGVKRFVFVSSSKARYPTHSAYAQLKAQAESELRQLHTSSFEVVCVRPALVYGPGMRGNLRSLLRVLSRPSLPVFPGSEHPLGMISRRDLCRALVCVAAAGPLPDQIWELADGQRYTLNAIVRGVRGALGLPMPAWLLPRKLFRMAAAASGALGGSFSLSTYRTLFEESYEADQAFSRHTAFVAKDTFFSDLPFLLKDFR